MLVIFGGVVGAVGVVVFWLCCCCCCCFVARRLTLNFLVQFVILGTKLREGLKYTPAFA
jgi:hypothetical protein